MGCYLLLEPQYRKCGRDFYEFSCLPQENNRLARVNCRVPAGNRYMPHNILRDHTSSPRAQEVEGRLNAALQ